MLMNTSIIKPFHHKSYSSFVLSNINFHHKIHCELITLFTNHLPFPENTSVVVFWLIMIFPCCRIMQSHTHLSVSSFPNWVFQPIQSIPQPHTWHGTRAWVKQMNSIKNYENWKKKTEAPQFRNRPFYTLFLSLFQVVHLPCGKARTSPMMPTRWTENETVWMSKNERKMKYTKIQPPKRGIESWKIVNN